MEGATERYQKLGLQESLGRSCNYSSACRELTLIFRLSYSKFPKSLQSIVFQDLLTAFQFLPWMQTQSAISAANTLVQAAESVLPKQKKALAVTELKQAMIAHKRRSKARRDEELVELPQDVLVHIFRSLDLQSLVSASQVCRSWNAASSDNHLWQLKHTTFFNTVHNFSKIDKLHGGLADHEKSESSKESIACNNNIDWRTNFKIAYNGLSSKKHLTYSRGLCTRCHAIVWVTDMCFETASKLECKYLHIEPISPSQVVEYIDVDYASRESDSDSEFYDEYWSSPVQSRQNVPWRDYLYQYITDD